MGWGLGQKLFVYATYRFADVDIVQSDKCSGVSGGMGWCSGMLACTQQAVCGALQRESM